MSEHQETSTIFTKREYSNKPPNRKRTAWRILLYLAAACVLAGGVYAVYAFLPDRGADAASSDALRTRILHLQPEDVESIAVQNTTPFTLLGVVTDTAAQSDGADKVTWQLAGADDAVVDLSATKSYAESLLSIEALRTMTGTNGDYGFPEDSSGITIRMRDGTAHTLQFGDPSLDQIGHYMLLDSTTVYVVDSTLAEQLQATPESFGNREVIEAFSTEDYAEYVSNGAIAGFDRLEILQKDLPPTVITARKVGDTFEYAMENPKNAAVSAEDMQPLLSILQNGLKADGLYGYGIIDPQNANRAATWEAFAAAAEYTVRLKLGDTQSSWRFRPKRTTDIMRWCAGI